MTIHSDNSILLYDEHFDYILLLLLFLQPESYEQKLLYDNRLPQYLTFDPRGFLNHLYLIKYYEWI